MRSGWSRASRLAAVFLIGAASAGVAATVYAWLQADPELHPPSAAMLAAGLVVALGASANLLIRFVRWHFLLRRVGVRLPMIPSLGIFVGSFGLLPAPFLLGQVLARVRLPHGLDAAARRRILVVFGWERLLDVLALGVLATPCAPRVGMLAAAGTVLLACPPLARGVVRRVTALTRPLGRLILEASPDPTADEVAPLGRAPEVGVAVGLSLLAWGMVAGSLVPLVRVAVPAPPGALVGAAAWSTLAGGVSGVPLGVGIAGILLLTQLEHLAIVPALASPIVFVFRVASVWLTVVIGLLALALLRPRLAHASHPHDDHFDSIDSCYDAWLPPHYRLHLVGRKTSVMRRWLDATAPGRGLDIGCGRGWYAAALRGAGAVMTGVDTSIRQLVAAREYAGRDLALARGRVEGLPFATGTFDFAYIVNVLHHVPTPAGQRAALIEIGRVVRPGGLVFVHEMSIANPLFRLYLSYVFPILKGVEEGTEYYLDPERMREVPGLEVEAVERLTFLPDFVPAALLPILARFERWLEGTVLVRWAAHFVVVYRRREGP